MKSQLKILKIWLLCAGFFAWAAESQAADLNLANAPLYLGTSIDPNVFFQVDDSGSMDWEVMTEEYYYYLHYWQNQGEDKLINGQWRNYAAAGAHHTGSRRNYNYIFYAPDSLYHSNGTYANAQENPESLLRDWRGRASAFNLIYYDPTTSYQPWEGLPDAVFSAARSDPQPGSDGYTNIRDLSGFVFELVFDDHGYNGLRPDGPSDATDTPNGEVDIWDSRDRYTVLSASMTVDNIRVPVAASMAAIGSNCSLAAASLAVPYSSCFGTTMTSSAVSTVVNPWGRSLAEEQQNIANWFQYYRKRSYITKAAVAQVVVDQNDFRYGLSLINDWGDVFVEVPSSGVTNYISHNASLLDDLFDYDWQGQGTPLRRGLEVVGKYFDDNLSGKSDPIISECQQNFSILFTDGYWNGSNPASAIGDADGDGHNRTVSDVAKYYYDKDLSPLSDHVPTSVIDGNDQQHMVTFTVAYGVEGDLVDTNNDGYPDPELDENDDWGNPFNSDPEKIDDMWHAAYNSKGYFIAAQRPEEVVSAITDALSEISDRVGSSASVATNSGSLNAGSHLFQARFDSDRWSGQLLAFALNADGSIKPIPDWDARDVLDTQDYNTGRTILTYNRQAASGAGGGVKFRFPSDYQSPDANADMNSAQLAVLLDQAPFPYGTTDPTERLANGVYGQDIVNYFRGDRTNEGFGGDFRTRNFALGDIVDSDPKFVGPPRARYPDTLEPTHPYSVFRDAMAGRDPMVYVGANDGMLHGFAEADGEERLGFIPSAVFPNLSELAEDTYVHRYFVNEAPTVVDAFMQNYANGDSTYGAWRTILVGGLGAGGQGIYALDVTDPDDFSEGAPNSTVLWEFGDWDDPDLGYTYSVPSIAKMADGSWVAIFGNGYNNTDNDGAQSGTGHASLFIVDIETGSLISKIDTEAGSTGTPNGLASPALIDFNNDQVVDYIYAGDLEGNMWKFDVTSSSPGSWDVAHKSGGVPEPIFTTSSGQPITTRPQVTTHPENLHGYMVFFGTGKYLETNDDDPTSSVTQSFYGIWDKDESTLTPFDRTDLQAQYITNQYDHDVDTDGDGSTDETYVLRDVSDNALNYSSEMGWYIDLLPQKINGTANADNFGEMQVSNALVRNGRVILTTLLPSQGLCDSGGSSFIMELDYRDGSQLGFPAFDLNGDGLFDAADTLAAGKQSDVGIVPTLSVLLDGDSEIAYGSGSSGDIDVIKLNPGANSLGRQSWRQLR